MDEIRKEIEENTLLLILSEIELSEEQVNIVKNAINWNSEKICLEFSKEIGNVLTKISRERECIIGDNIEIKDHCERILKHIKLTNQKWYYNTIKERNGLINNETS